MHNLIATVIMKTDLAEFTSKVSQSTQSDLATILATHKDIIGAVVSKNDGKIIKGEGDSYWITFSSVTTAALSAIEIQQEFSYAQAGRSEEKTLKVRIAIAIGDVLHQEGDIFGDTVNLTARIESITPPNDIYLSNAAWLVLNKAEISNSYVGEYSLKGIENNEKVYKIDQKHKTRIIKDQVVVFTDTRKFTLFKDTYSMEDVEVLLTEMENAASQACEKYGGTIRATIGDAHFMTFTDTLNAVKAVKTILDEWQVFLTKNNYPSFITSGIHRADVFIFRSCIYGDQINKAAILQALCNAIDPEGTRNMALLSAEIYSDLNNDTEYGYKSIDPKKIETHLRKRVNEEFRDDELIYELML